MSDWQESGSDTSSHRRSWQKVNRQADSGWDSGPPWLLVEVPAVKFQEITSGRAGESSAQVRARVLAARQTQQRRFEVRPRVTCNARMGSRELKQHCGLDEGTMDLLKFAMNDLRLSARAYDRILKVAMTIADLGGSERIRQEDVSEAIQLRSLDRQLWT